MNKKVGIFMPARLNSERLPNKLILPMGDSNLFRIACEKLNSLPAHINKYVLIHDAELIEIAQDYANIQIIIRDIETVNVDGPLTFIFKELQDLEDTHLMFLNPCLAFLKTETIKDAVDLFEDIYADYATSVKPFHNWIVDLNGISLNPIDYKRLTTKEIYNLYQFAHCFHIFNKDKFFQDGQMLKQGFLPILVSEEETIDVDTATDYEFARWKYEICN